ncbi:hypothetical protein FKM82_021220 [Ascaphus truei]
MSLVGIKQGLLGSRGGHIAATGVGAYCLGPLPVAPLGGAPGLWSVLLEGHSIGSSVVSVTVSEFSSDLSGSPANGVASGSSSPTCGIGRGWLRCQTFTQPSTSLMREAGI